MKVVICVAVDGIKWMMVVGVDGLGFEKKKVEELLASWLGY